MGTFGLVELQGAGDAFEDVVGDAVGVAAFEPGVVLDADPGEHRYFLAAQSLDAPVGPVDGKSGLFRGDLGAAGGEELADAVLVVHGLTLRRRAGGWESLLVPLLTRSPTPAGLVVGYESAARSRVDVEEM